MNPLDRARFARRAQICEQYLYQCLTGRRDMSPEKAVRLERESGGAITRQQVNRNWRAIWPELATLARARVSKEDLKIKRKGRGGTRAARTPARTPTREAADPAPPPPSQPAPPAKRAQKTGGWVEAEKPDDIEQDLWDDWCRQRTAHRWHLSDRAVAGIRSQARVVGITLQDAVELMLVNDWRGFNARWESVRAAVGVQRQHFQTARERDLESVRQQHKEMYGDWWGEWEEKERGALPGLPSQQVFDVPALVMEQQKNG